VNAGAPSSPVRAPAAWRALAFVATCAALALVAIVIAHWGWRWFGPERVHIPRAAAPDPAATLAMSNLFGTQVAPPAAVAAAPEVLRGELRLLGVFAETKGGGAALFRLPGGSSRLVAVGKTIDGDATLVAVRPDGITVRDGSGERTIALRAAPAAVAAAASGSRAQAAVPRNPACAAPAGFTGALVRLNAELVQGLIAQPDSWRGIVESRDGALSVREDGGFAAMLGLKRDDRIEQANGIALRVPDDVIGAVLRPLAASQTVRLEGRREGQRRELLLQNAGACPG
jgi:type II secretory pathway component PulC